MSGIFNILDNTVKELAVSTSRLTTDGGNTASSLINDNFIGMMHTIRLRGTLSHRKVFRLAFCSKSLSKRIRCRYVSIKRNKNSWILEPNGNHKLWIYKNGRAEISIGKLLTEVEKSKIKNNLKHVQIILNKDFCLGNFVQNARAYLNPVYEGVDIPENVMWIKSSLNRNRNKGDRLIMARKAIYELSRKRDMRVLFQNTNEGIILRLSNDNLRGRKLWPAKIRNGSYHVEVSFPVQLQSYMKDCIGVPLKEFELRESDFTENITEKMLLDALIDRKIRAYSGTTRTSGDIFFKDYNGFVEITTFKPMNSQISQRHSITSMQIRSRIFEAEHFSIHRNINPNFIIVDDIWKNNSHIIKESIEAEKYRVYTIFTNFKGNWNSKVADEICKKL